MTGNLTNSADIQSRDLIATRELHVDGGGYLNSTLTKKIISFLSIILLQ